MRRAHLTARVAKDRISHLWEVHLTIHTAPSMHYGFGSYQFFTWEQARDWAVWRVASSA